MSYLLFKTTNQYYAINNLDILRIIPSVPLRKIETSTNYLIGLLMWGQNQIPIVDFSILTENRPTMPAYYSRIILLTNETKKCVGLLAEKVTEMIDINFSTQEKAYEAHYEMLPFLESIFPSDQGLIFLISVKKLFEYLTEIPIPLSIIAT